MTERTLFDVEVCDRGRWILTGSYQTATHAISVAKEEGGTTRRSRVRADRWDEDRKVYVGTVIFEYEPAVAASYKDRYLEK